MPDLISTRAAKEKKNLVDKKDYPVNAVRKERYAVETYLAKLDSDGVEQSVFDDDSFEANKKTAWVANDAILRSFRLMFRRCGESDGPPDEVG
jgi:hypothetical protein